MFGLGNIFSGLGNLFTMPNMLTALDFLGKGFGVYQQIDSLLNPPKMPDFDRLDLQGNQPMSMPSPTAPMSPQQQALRFASARSNMAERGIGPGGAFNNPLQTSPGMFNDSPETLYAMLGQGQALPFDDDDLYGGSY